MSWERHRQDGLEGDLVSLDVAPFASNWGTQAVTLDTVHQARNAKVL